jgi:hypothetical protein
MGPGMPTPGSGRGCEGVPWDPRDPWRYPPWLFAVAVPVADVVDAPLGGGGVVAEEVDSSVGRRAAEERATCRR